MKWGGTRAVTRQRWFAWHPVKCEDDKLWCWLEVVIRVSWRSELVAATFYFSDTVDGMLAAGNYGPQPVRAGRR